jgi:hypothetical protein
MITFVTWKWHTPGSGREFLAEHVNVLYSMVDFQYQQPFRFVCITDDPAGLDPDIETMPMPVRFDDVPNPQGKRFPQCYCRLWNFSREATILGERILQLDIDLVILDFLMPLIDRDEDFVGWCDPKFGWRKIAGGIYLLKTGSMPHIWDDFDPATSPQEAAAAGYMGSDQAWMSYKMYPPAGQWSNGDGLVKLNWTPEHAKEAPEGARIVFTNGAKPPWNAEIQARYPWIKEYWR